MNKRQRIGLALCLVIIFVLATRPSPKLTEWQQIFCAVGMTCGIFMLIVPVEQ